MNRLFFRFGICLVVILAILRGSGAFAHDTPLHRIITNAVWPKSDGLSNFRSDVEISGANCPVDIIERLLYGSESEDAEKLANWIPDRVLRHFYDPISKEGLSDVYARIPAGLLANSFDWATDNWENTWEWKDARSYEYKALTEGSESSRNENLKKTFRAIGQLMHLVEDNSEPEHVRNDAHTFFSFMEDYGREHGAELVGRASSNSKADALKWKDVGFTKLKDFWDRDKLCPGGASALNRNSGKETLGLSEFANGNFLGSTALYGELFSPWQQHWYRYPTLNNTNYTAFAPIPGEDADGAQRPHYYVAKTGAGESVTHHSMLTFSAVYRPNPQNSKTSVRLKIPSFETNNEAVLKEYHDIILPPTISYAAGCLDYYFRGRIEATATADPDKNQIVVDITNNTDLVMDGGQFELYKDDENKNRTKVTQFTVGSGNLHLEPSASVTGTITQGASFKVDKCMLVYKGSISVPNETKDPVDTDIAIAARTVEMPKIILSFECALENGCHDGVGWVKVTSPDGDVLFDGCPDGEVSLSSKIKAGTTIAVQYSNTQGPCPGGHDCDIAVFNLKLKRAGKVDLGQVNLNNGNDGGDRGPFTYTITQQQLDQL